MNKQCGILLHISSLPSPYGIGSLGDAAFETADRISRAGFSVWQVLPVGPTGFGDSPYQSFSTFAGNPYLIDLDYLVRDGYLQQEDLPAASQVTAVDYGALYAERFDTLRKAYDYSVRTMPALPKKLETFAKERPQVYEFALFMTIKETLQLSWQDWPKELRMHEEKALSAFVSQEKEEIFFRCFIQYLFFEQWKSFKAYVNGLGIRLLGDLPIYVAADSSDVWADADLFLLDEDRRPCLVAGVPPDYFSEDGQLWGNPLYDWDKMKSDDFAWWKKRIGAVAELFDMVRLDHFIGFANYYTIKAGSLTAREGEWRDGPGMELFHALRQAAPQLEIIAEDLGVVSDKVKKLLADSDFPGMKCLVFAWGGGDDNPHRPHNVIENSVLYTGTHDNEPVTGWWLQAPAHEKDAFLRYCLRESPLSVSGEDRERELLIRLGELINPSETMIRMALASTARLVIIPLQDLLGLGSEARMNHPGRTGCWTWRMPAEALSAQQISRMRELLVEAERIGSRQAEAGFAGVPVSD